MKQSDLVEVAKIRIIVGFLGERSRYSWWASSFFDASSRVFISPILVKTSFLAQYNGVKEAAGRVHDEHLGVGSGVFHLFRFPEFVEQRLQVLLQHSNVTEQLEEHIRTEATAFEELRRYEMHNIPPAVGPIRIGGFKDVENLSTWRLAGHHYAKAFETGSPTFPFISGEV